jgi:hypothetical protein
MRSGRCVLRPGRLRHGAVAAARRVATLLITLAAPAAAEEVEADIERSVESLLPALLQPPSRLLSLEPGFLRVSVRGAVETAAQRLAGPRCQILFGEFRDEQGRRLQERLDESRLTPTEFLRSIRFVSGAGHAPCASREVLAFSTPGLRTVAVCPDSFNRVQRSNPELASHIVIHELLHTLGLGENPPSSLEITARVRKRCNGPTIASR